MNTFLSLLSLIPYILFNVSAQEVSQPISQPMQSFRIPRPAISGPPNFSIFSNVLIPAGTEPPIFLNLMPRKATVFSRNIIIQKTELKTFAVKNPLFFLRLQQNSVVLLSTLKGLSPIQVSNMSIFCFGKLFYNGPFANQIVLKFNESYTENSECVVAVEYEERKGSNNLKTLESRVVLLKSREI